MTWCRRAVAAVTVAIALAAAAPGCGSSETGDPTAADAGAGGDGRVMADGSTGAADAAAPDAHPLDFGPIDCAIDSDCPGLSRCSETVPGGACNGCWEADDCPPGTRCTQLGACVRDCTADSECSRGEHCLPGVGRCAIRSRAAGPSLPRALGASVALELPGGGAVIHCADRTTHT